MPRPRKNGEPTRLGTEVRSRRADLSLHALGAQIGLTYATLSNIERGTHYPSPRTARLLATWLGWTVGQVFDAAEAPEKR